MSRPLAVFDIDGVLADVRHRLHFLERKPKDWAGFFAAAPKDPPLAEGLRLLREAAADCDIAYVTGRPESCRADTLTWMRQHDLPGGELIMRSRRDRRPARAAKPELIQGLLNSRVLAVVVDDDLEVCDAYEALGLPVLRAGWATSSETLTEAQEGEGRT